MATLGDVMAYLCEHYPRKHELSKARLAKLIYLADWKSAIERGEQMTNIVWVYNYHGPYVEDVAQEAEDDPAFKVRSTHNLYGEPKDLIELVRPRGYPSLTEDDRRILDSIIASTAEKNWNEFIRLVYSTYPIITQDRFSKLDLVELARRYAEDQASLRT
jgi:hypothetical protein